MIRHVLQLTGNLYREYKTAPDALKRHYLGLFWDRFVVRDRRIVRAIPTDLIRALQEEGEVINRKNWLPSSPLIITLQNRAYLAELASKVAAIQRFLKIERAA